MHPSRTPEENITPISSTSYSESFPLLVEKNGNNIAFNEHVSIFDGVQLISRYLENRFEVDPEKLSTVKLTEILEIF